MSKAASESPPSKKLRVEGLSAPTTTTAMDAEPAEDDLSQRWSSLATIMGRPTAMGGEKGPLKLPGAEEFECDPELHEMVAGAKILCVGAGGLGCELLKDLALSGFTDIHVIDMDHIDITNLNRQFLFRKKDVGEPKATVAAAFVNGRVPGVQVTAHVGKLQDHEPEWYKEYNLVIAGLDNIEARRWLNKTLCDLVDYEEDGSINPESVIPLIDGGTEGFKGQARVILPMHTSCFECTMDMFPQNKGKAVCTLESNPRQPEDCAIYIFMKLEDDEKAGKATFTTNEQVFVSSGGAAEGAGESTGVVLANENALDDDALPEDCLYTVKLADGSEQSGVKATSLTSLKTAWDATFGAGTRVDKDLREHMVWIHSRAAERAAIFKIDGLTYDKTLGSVKNIIPAVASTNAVIAAACVHEATKVLSYCNPLLNTYLLYNGQSMAGGCDCSTLVFERKLTCSACRKVLVVPAAASETVGDFVARFKAESTLDPPMVEPQLSDSAGDVFYASKGMLAQVKAANLGQPLSDFVEHMETVSITDSHWDTETVVKLKLNLSS